MFDHAAQLADVAGPGVGHEHLLGVGADAVDLLAMIVGRLLHEVMDEQGNIFASFAQGRDGDGHALDAEIKILAELFFGDHFLERAVGGADQADIDLDGIVGAQADDFAIFQDAQQLGLHGGGHVADFVHEEGAAVGVLEAPFALGAARR